MPGFCFTVTDDVNNSLLEKIIIQDKVLTMYFNFKLASKLNHYFQVDVRQLVQHTDRNGKLFTFIREGERGHDGLHVEFPDCGR